MKEGVKVSSHRHKLKAEYRGDAYICDGCQERGIWYGCQERGIEWRYACRACNYDMHNFCATAPPIIRHPLTNAKMTLYPWPAVGIKSRCSACERYVLGMLYYCRASGDILHPLCARLLQETLRVDSYTLRLSGSLSAGRCNVCDRTARGWAYLSTDYRIHVHCLKKFCEGNPGSGVPRLSRGRCLQLTAPISTSYHRHPQAGSATSGVLHTYEPRRSNVWLKGFCKITKLLVTIVCAVLFGNPIPLFAALASGS